MKTIRSLRWRNDDARAATYLLLVGLNAGRSLRRMKMKALLFGTVLALATFGSAAAAEVEIKMLDKGTEGVRVFEPAVVKIDPGDTVKFVAANKGHNVEPIKTMIPADAAPFAGKMNEDTSITFEKPGVYGVKCLP